MPMNSPRLVLIIKIDLQDIKRRGSSVSAAYPTVRLSHRPMPRISNAS